MSWSDCCSKLLRGVQQQLPSCMCHLIVWCSSLLLHFESKCWFSVTLSCSASQSPPAAEHVKKADDWNKLLAPNLAEKHKGQAREVTKYTRCMDDAVPSPVSCVSQVWWHTPRIPILRRHRLEGHSWIQSQPKSTYGDPPKNIQTEQQKAGTQDWSHPSTKQSPGHQEAQVINVPKPISARQDWLELPFTEPLCLEPALCFGSPASVWTANIDCANI